jgi:hypothetical protein
LFLLPDIFEVFFSSDPIGIGQLLEGPHILKTKKFIFITPTISMGTQLMIFIRKWVEGIQPSIKTIKESIEQEI